MAFVVLRDEEQPFWWYKPSHFDAISAFNSSTDCQVAMCGATVLHGQPHHTNTNTRTEDTHTEDTHTEDAHTENAHTNIDTHTHAQTDRQTHTHTDTDTQTQRTPRTHTQHASLQLQMIRTASANFRSHVLGDVWMGQPEDRLPNEADVGVASTCVWDPARVQMRHMCMQAHGYQGQ